MVAALIQWQIQYPSETVWTNITGRVIREAVFREGRAIEQLGGPEADGRTSSLSLILNNSDGYFTKGAGSEYDNSRVRLRWRKAIGDAWEVRFVGRLSERRLVFEGYSLIRTRWLGALWKLKAGSIPKRTAIGTIGEIALELATAAGIPASEQNFPTGGDDYGLSLQAGYEGVRDFLGLVAGTMFDDPEGRVTLETETVRAARAVSQTYREGVGSGIEIAPPDSQTKPFGIINELDLQVQVFNPADMVAASVAVVVPQTEWRVRDAAMIAQDKSLTVTLDNPPLSPTVNEWSLTFEGVNTLANVGDNSGTPSGTVTQSDFPDATTIVEFRDTDVMDGGAIYDYILFQLSNPRITVIGSLVTFTIAVLARRKRQGETFFDMWRIPSRLRANGTIMVQDTVSFDQQINTYDFQGCDASSIARYGTRPRETHLLLAIQRTTPPPADYEPPADLVSDAIQGELARYSAPVPVVSFALDGGTTARRDDLMDRRIGQKVHVVADGRSQLGHDDDFFVEAQEVRITPLGELASTLWCVQAPPPPPPPPPPAQPTGFQIFRLDNMSLLLFWDNPNDADITGYRIWRGTSSGDINTEIENSVGSASTTQYTDDGLTNNQEYWYQIQAPLRRDCQRPVGRRQWHPLACCDMVGLPSRPAAKRGEQHVRQNFCAAGIETKAGQAGRRFLICAAK